MLVQPIGRAKIKGDFRRPFMHVIVQLILQLTRQLRHRVKQIRDQANIGDREDRRVLILVDGDDRLAVLHSRQMLDRARYADSDIDFRRDDLAGLPDLIVVGGIARINRRAARADARAEFVGERVDNLVELFGAAQRAATRYDDFGRRQFGAFGLGDFFADKSRKASFAGARHRLNARAATATLGLVERGAAHRDDQLGVLALDRRNRVACINRAGEGLWPSTEIISLICITSRSAATRGAIFFPVVVAGATKASWCPISAATSGATFSGSACA